MEKAPPIPCPYCGAELVQVRLAPGGFQFLAGWTCATCSPVLSTTRLAGKLLGLFRREGEATR